MHADSSHARSICLVGSSRQYPDYNQSPFPGYRTGDAAAKGRPSPPVPGPRWLIGIVTDSDTSIWVLFLFLWFRSYHVWSDNRRYFGCIAPKGTAGNHFLPLPLVHELGPTVTLLEEGFDVFFLELLRVWVDCLLPRSPPRAAIRWRDAPARLLSLRRR